MDTPVDVVAMINEAVAAKNWPLLVVAVLMILVPIVLHLVGKDVPVVSVVLMKIAEFLKARKPVVEEPVKPEDAPKGLGSVVKVEEAPKE